MWGRQAKAATYHRPWLVPYMSRSERLKWYDRGRDEGHISSSQEATRQEGCIEYLQLTIVRFRHLGLNLNRVELMANMVVQRERINFCFYTLEYHALHMHMVTQYSTMAMIAQKTHEKGQP
jgi:hypothetical protein